MTTPRRALITGSTRNIGLAIAERLARDGYAPILNHAHDAEQAASALASVRALCPQAELVRADVTRESDVERMIREATSNGPVDLLVNNVGAFLLKPFLETSLEEWNGILASNLVSTFLCCRGILPMMRIRGQGQIINIVSVNAERQRAVPNTLPYAIAKAGVALMTKTLAKTEGPHGIRVNGISPGFVNTGANLPANVPSSVPLGRAARPEEIAAAASFLASDEAAYITGSILNVHGGALL